jgi:pyrroline-5-carboxylate reductase
LVISCFLISIESNRIKPIDQSTANLQDLVRDSKLDISRVAKMICLPSIARHKGVALLCCGDSEIITTDSTTTTTKAFLSSLFTTMGGVVCLDTEADLEACMVTTCTMGPLYGTMKNQRDWLLKHTDSLSKTDASFLVVEQFAGAISDASRKLQSNSNRLEDLIEEQTPGGLNEQALKNYGTVLGGFAELQDPVMDAILSRIRGETDGSLNNGKKEMR